MEVCGAHTQKPAMLHCHSSCQKGHGGLLRFWVNVGPLSKFNGNVAIVFEKTQDFTDYVKFIPERTPVKRGGSYQEHGQFPLEAPTSVEARSKSGDKTKPTTYIENGEG